MSDEKKDDGGPAFPVPNVNNWYGLSLRDWFAGQAIANLLETNDIRLFGAIRKPYLAKAASTAYELADAMIEARKQ